jgi:hypothetical protein
LAAKEVEMASGSDPGVFLAQGTGGGAARVGEQPGIGHLLVELLKALRGHIYLTALLNGVRDVLTTELLGNAADGAHVGCPVLADQSVAACGADSEPSTLVGERHGQPVDFQLADVGKSRVGQDVLCPFLPGAEFLFAAGVGQAQHRDRMPVLWHVLDGSRTTPTNALRWGVRRLQFRVILLDSLQLHHQLVVLGIRQDWIVLNVVLIGGFFDAVTHIGDVGRQVFCFRMGRHTAPFSLGLVAGLEPW